MASKFKLVQLILYMLHLLKSNVPKLVWYHGTSVYWKIAALIVGSAEIRWVCFILGCASPHPALYGPYILRMCVCMYVYMHAYIHTGINIYIGPALFGVVGPVQATSFHILLARWANKFSDSCYPISHSHRSSFQWLALAIHPSATIKHKLHLNLILAMLYDFEIIKCYTSLARSIIKIHHGISRMAVC